MAKGALYQKYRSTTFEEVIGQEYTVRAIKNAVRENKIGHAYLFCGPRGTGKTTMARLLAKAVNCTNPAEAPCGTCENCRAAAAGTHPDIVEMNAANETHVENIRDLIERCRLAPLQGKYKVYIIDEVHQLSSAASSALLKTLEEPPENVIFVLATTDPQKLLPTIVSRTQRFDFTRIDPEKISSHLKDIAAKENIFLESEAADTIASLAEGGMRDALSIMDQCAAFTSDNITAEEINRIYGLTGVKEKADLLGDILTGNLEGILNRTGTYEETGIDLSRFIEGTVDIIKDEVVWLKTKKKTLLKTLNAEQAADLAKDADAARLLEAAEELMKVRDRFRFGASSIAAFEVACLNLAVKDTPSAPAQPEVSPPQNKPEEAPLKKIPALTEEEILSVLVVCDKQNKALDEETFVHVKQTPSSAERKYTSLLQDATVAASGKTCILLTVKNQALANRINDPVTNNELRAFMERTAGKDKKLFAASEEAISRAVSAYRQRRREGTLPTPVKIETAEKKAEKTPEDRLREVFGEDIVEVI